MREGSNRGKDQNGIDRDEEKTSFSVHFKHRSHLGIVRILKRSKEET